MAKQRNQGKKGGFHGDPERHKAISQKGGQKTRDRHGTAFYSEIGKMGGIALKEERGIDFFRQIGRMSHGAAAASEGAKDPQG